MAKATITLSNGTRVHIDGTPEEITRLMEMYNGNSDPAKSSRRARRPKPDQSKPPASDTLANGSVDHVMIINAIKEAGEFDSIESRILERASQLDRTLLPLYAAHEYVDSKMSLTSGDIAKVLAELGNPVKIQNVSTTLAGRACRFVIADGIRKSGTPVGYRIHRRGVQYLKEVLQGL